MKDDASGLKEMRDAQVRPTYFLADINLHLASQEYSTAGEAQAAAEEKVLQGKSTGYHVCQVIRIVRRPWEAEVVQFPS